ncbi:MAG: hypothetical protein FJ333_09150 [Sphingomonadales bacterium]|nr:hypothetical protein [Sphingomonadales bacterium]
MLLRGTLSQNWVKALKIVTHSLNDTPLQRLGWLKPNDINSEVDSVHVDQAKKTFGIDIYKEPNYIEQRQNEESYKSDLNVGDFVYKQFETKLFDKSFDVSVK